MKRDEYGTYLQLDKSGNVTGQEPYVPYIVLLVVLAVIAAFFVAASILSFFERRR